MFTSLHALKSLAIEMSNIELSIIIPTFNGARRIGETLHHLYGQKIDSPIAWEIIVVDNNSRDETASVVKSFIDDWRADCQLKYTFESQQGAAFARSLGVAEAQTTSLLGFLDDDNWPAENWINEVIAFARSNPKAGAFGGLIHAELEGHEPPDFNVMKGYLTIVNRGGKPFQYKRSDKPRRIPPAPGVVIRKQAWDEVMPDPQKLLIGGRNANTMAAGEDAEMMFYLQNSQWEVWHNPKMEIWHYIPNHRLEKDYILKLARGYGLSNHLTRLSRYPSWQRPLVQLATPLFTVRDLIRLLYFYLKNWTVLQENFGKACRLQVGIGQLWSPYLRLYGWCHRMMYRVASKKS